MANTRKQIILNEIMFWKQSKLLPEHYCDFLATLYTEGGASENEQQKQAKNAVLAKEKRTNIIITVVLALVGVLSTVAMFALTSLTSIYALIVAVVTAFLFIRAAGINAKNPALAIFYHTFGALLVFGLTMYVAMTTFPNNDPVLFGSLLANSLFWLFIGVRRKLVYFTIAGSLAALLIIGYWLYITL